MNHKIRKCSGEIDNKRIIPTEALCSLQLKQELLSVHFRGFNVEHKSLESELRSIMPV